MLITLEEFAHQYFAADSQPTHRQLYYWCTRGYLPTKKIGRKIFVDTERLTPGSPNVERILGGLK